MPSAIQQKTLFLTAVLLGCGGGGDGGDGGTPPSTTAIAKAPTSGDAQSAAVGQVLPNPLQVVVTEGGAPKAGASVTWSTTSGGTLNPTSAATDANGTASTSWTLGTTSGSQTAQATLSGASGSPVSFTATAAPGPAATLEEEGGNGQSATVETPLPAPVRAQVSDEFGNGVPGVAVGWTATNGTVSAPSVTSDAAGISSVNVTAGATPGPITITATSGTLAGSPVTFTATANPAPTGSATVQVVNNQFNPGTLTVDAGTTVVWNWPAGSFQHTVTPDNGSVPTGTGLRNGPATHQFTFTTPGTYAYHCQQHGGPGGLGMSGTITVE